MTIGARQHFIPAALIGEFSSHLKGPGRTRPVYVRRRGESTAVARLAGDVAWKRRYYTILEPMGEWSGNAADQAWRIYEPELISALHELRDNPVISAETYLWRLVPFVAGVFTRGLDHELHDREQKRTFGDNLRVANVNYMRMLEFGRLLGVLLLAEWRIYHRRGGLPLILNDRGYMIFRLAERVVGPAYYIPLSCDSALMLMCGGRAPVVDIELERVEGIVHEDLPADSIWFNAGIANAAVTEIY